jgi:hypothetical protein
MVRSLAWWRKIMNTLDLGRATQNRELQDDELDAVSGGTEGYPGLPLGTNINVSPWGLTTPFDLKWALVGATGHLWSTAKAGINFPAFVFFVDLLSCLAEASAATAQWSKADHSLRKALDKPLRMPKEKTLPEHPWKGMSRAGLKNE